MIYCNKRSTKTIQLKPAAMTVQRALMHRERRPFIMYLRQMRSLNKILFTNLNQLTSHYTNPSPTQGQITIQTTLLIHTPASSRNKYTMTCLSAHKQQTHPYREQHDNQSFMYVSYGRHNSSKISKNSLRKA